MHDTSPPILSVWSGLAAPLCCLANKSQARLCSESLQSALEANLSGFGSMIYQTVWKPRVTPLGRQIYRLRASARRTSDSEHSLERSGWMTPRARGDAGGNRWKTNDIRNLEDQIRYNLSGWNTLRATDGSNGGPNQAGGALTPDAALSGRPTPTTRDYKGATENTLTRADGRKRHDILDHAALISHWPVPDQAARIMADGTMLTGCSAGMESGGQLNPAFNGWLMGFPEAWCHAAISCQLPARLRKAPKKPVA